MKLNRTQILINRTLTIIVLLSLMLFVVVFISRGKPKTEIEVHNQSSTWEIKPYNGSYPTLDRLTRQDEEVVLELSQIATYDMLGVTESDFWYLVKIVFTEGNMESDYGQRLIVHTVLNRVRDERFPNTIKGVIEQPSQFCGRWVNNWGRYTENNVDNVIKALWDRENGFADETELAVLYFHNHNVVASRGYARRFGLRKLVVEGNHTFLE